MSDISLLETFYNTAIRKDADPPFSKLSEQRKQNLERGKTYKLWCEIRRHRIDNLLMANATLQSNLGTVSSNAEKEDAKIMWRTMLSIIRTFDPAMATRMSDEHAEPFELANNKE